MSVAGSDRWTRRLSPGDPRRDETMRRLHQLLLRMAYANLVRGTRRGDLDELAHEAADEALVGVLRHLDDFRGESRFTTWACRFVLTEVAAALRRRRRWGLEVPTEADALTRMVGQHDGPDRELERAQLLRDVLVAVRSLTPRQREVVLALAVEGRPARRMAQGLGVSDGAVYKSLHDARRAMRAQLSR